MVNCVLMFMIIIMFCLIYYLFYSFNKVDLSKLQIIKAKYYRTKAYFIKYEDEFLHEDFYDASVDCHFKKEISFKKRKDAEKFIEKIKQGSISLRRDGSFIR